MTRTGVCLRLTTVGVTLVLSSRSGLLSLEKYVESEVGVFDSCSQGSCREGDDSECGDHSVLIPDEIGR